MALTSGSTLGSYEIVAPLGAGGMGEVYRARDARLGRSVAIKILPDDVARDPDRVARFEREARVLGSLNHPHIATLYGLEHVDGRHLLLMELVEGETIADRLARGTPPLKETLAIALQIAEALEAAHEIGIVHRDLKPANVKITPDDKVKVLDFGLAKALDPRGGDAVIANSPTLSFAATQAGLILGTAAYMSLEQAKGLPADTRSDVFSFGAVLFELLSGRQAFTGETVPDILASVLARDPDWSQLPPATPPRLITLTKRCLAKPRRQRWQAIGDVRAELESIAAEPVDQPSALAASVVAPRRPLWVRIAAPLAAAVVAAAATAVWFLATRVEEARPITRFFVPMPEGVLSASGTRPMLAISPDGSLIAINTSAGIQLRAMDDPETRVMPGTERGFNPVFSPDGRSLAYVTGLGVTGDSAILRVPVAGGAPQTIVRVPTVYGMSWTEHGVIYAHPGGIFRVPASGGTPEQLVKLDNELLFGPQLVQDGKAVIFSTSPGVRGVDWQKSTLVAQMLPDGERRILVAGAADGRVLPTGHLVYALGGVLMAAPFDEQRLAITGEAFPVVEGVLRAGSVTGAAHYAFASNGTLVFAPGAATQTLSQRAIVMTTVAGEPRTPTLTGTRSYETPRVSRDGRFIAFGIEDGDSASIWIHDTTIPGSLRRLTLDGRSRYPEWSPDGRYIAYQVAGNDGGVFRVPADGSGAPERLTTAAADAVHVPESWTPDGKVLLYSVAAARTRTLWMMAVPGGQPTQLKGIESASPLGATISPDGKWLAYGTRTNLSLTRVFVEPFPPTGAKYQISSNDDGHHPLWSADGRRLYYVPGPGQLLGVDVTTSPAFAFGTPFNVPRRFTVGNAPTEVRGHDLTADGRFVGLAMPDGAGRAIEATASRINVVLNWFEDVRARAAAR